MNVVDDVDVAAAAFVTAGRALVGVALRSVAAAPVPLTLPQHRLLVLVSTGGPHRVGELAEELGVNQSNASRLVDRLVALGLVRRSRDRGDGRATVVEPTAAGRQVLDAVTRHRLRELRAVVGAMSPEHRSQAIEALHAFNAAAHESEVAPSHPHEES